MPTLKSSATENVTVTTEFEQSPRVVAQKPKLLSRLVYDSKALLRGMGQIMLQPNAATGALFLAGVGFNSIVMLAGAIAGLVTATYTARLLRYDEDDIRDGLYGFNGALIGIAMMFFYQPAPLPVGLTVIGAALTTILMRLFLLRGLPAFTAPFVATTWLAMYICTLLKTVQISHGSLPHGLNILSALLLGCGQVMFQGSIISGALFIAGLLLNSRKDAISGVYGAAAGIAVALVLAVPSGLVTLGLFGYNAVLCAIALSSRSKLLSFLSIIGSVLALMWCNSTGLIALTAPFVVCTWIAIVIDNSISKK